MASDRSKTRLDPGVKQPGHGVAAIDPNYEKDSYENDPARALQPGADTKTDTAALTSDDQAAQAKDWIDASPDHDGA